MRVNHNIPALNTYYQLTKNEQAQAKTTLQLSTGKRINSAADDAAGYAISQKMSNQIRGLDRASSNAQDGISLVQTASGSLSQTSDMLQRMRELAVQSASDTATSNDRQQMQKEMDQLAQQVSTVSNTTAFNGKNLLAGGFTAQQMQVGANQGDQIQLDIGAFDAKTLGLTANFGATLAGGANVSSISLSANTTLTTGTYTVDGTISTAATKAVLTGAAATADQSQLAVAAPADRTLTITLDGGTSVGITADATNFVTVDALAANLQSKINSTSLNGKLTVVNNGGKLQFNDISNISGSGSTLAITGTAADTLGFSAAVPSTTGTNAAGTLNLRDGNGIIVGSQAITTAGNSYSFSGLTVNLNEGSLPTTTNATFASNTIDVVAKASQAAVTGPNGLVVANATVEKGLLIDTQSNAANAITTIDNAINTVNSASTTLGAYQNRLEYAINTLGSVSQNLTSAESRITDIDMSKAVMENSKNGILAQAAQAMLAQANQQPQNVLQLLR